MRASRAKIKRKVSRVLLTILAVLVAILIIFPIIWIIPAAFKGRSELFSVPNTFFPTKWTWSNMEKVFSADLNGSSFVKSMGVTLLVAVLSTGCSRGRDV